MKARTYLLAACLVLLTTPSIASVFYVNVSNTAPASPFSTWDTAATNIQDAVNLSVNGDQVLVTNGIYQWGGIAMVGNLTNRVALTNAVTVQSVNGPWVTTIQGAGATNGNSAVRCAWLTNGASLIGFTLTSGATRTSGDVSGGGAWCASSNALVANCVIVSNNAYQYGGGVYQGKVIGSLILSNSSSCATYKSVLINDTIISNNTTGAYMPIAMTNCIIYFNSPNNNVTGTSFSHCCTTPALAGTGNFTNAPQLFVDGVHLNTNSPCIGTGTNVVTGTDIFGMAWSNPPSIGCAEWQPSPLVTTPIITLTSNPVGFIVGNVTISGLAPFSFMWLENGLPLQDNGHFNGSQSINLVATGINPSDIGNYQLVVSNSFGVITSSVAPLVIQSNVVTTPKITLTGNPVGFTVGSVTISGFAPFSFLWLENGLPLQNNGHFNNTQSTNLIATGLYFSDAGNYQLVVSNAFGVVTSSVAPLVIHCVASTGVNPVAPYSTWATAATNIQDAITASAAGDVVLVTNGVYATGGISMDGVITNRVSVNKAIAVQSVNGPNFTIIEGAWDPTSTNGPGAVRCAWLTNNAILGGFTLQGGATRSVTSSPNQSMYGGGVWGSSTSATVYNCVITNNYSSYAGGGAYSVTLNFCTLIGNHARGSGTPGSGIAAAGSGGGAASCNLNDCLVVSNFATQSYGGGAYNSNLKNCALVGNVCGYSGSGANGGTLVNCTVTGNRNVSGAYGSTGLAVVSAALTNCIVYGNIDVSSIATNFNYSSCTFSYSDTDPLPSGSGNLDVNPQILADNVHLAATSPCIGDGVASVVSGTDIDGQPWNNPPSIGCDEWQPAPIIAVQPSFQVNPVNHLLNFSTQIGGQSPLICQWSINGVTIQDSFHYAGSATPNLVISNFNLADAGTYQVVVSNSFGIVTSQVAQVVIHAVAAAGVNPVAPYSTWATAATNIQDAVDAALPGDIVLVTNGVYAYGGRCYNGFNGIITNRVLVTQSPLTILSINGYASTIIQGAWDPNTTNGPLAVRCCLLATGQESLTGFTLQGGATSGGPMVEFNPLSNDNVGGGVSSVGNPWPFASYSFTGGEVNNCLIISNTAGDGDGGGAGYVYLNNCILAGNTAYEGGGAYNSALINCTVSGNQASTRGGGTSNGGLYNCISFNNTAGLQVANSWSPVVIQYSCTTPSASGTGNINADPQFVDSAFHLAATSPCQRAGSSLYSSGVDMDGEAWNNPPSMGAEEVNAADFVGDLFVAIQTPQTTSFVGRNWNFTGQISGRAAGLSWDWGDGSTSTNVSYFTSHIWTNAGDYTVSFMAYNMDNPGGVSTNMIIHVLPLNPPQLLPLAMTAIGTNGFQLQFNSQSGAIYSLQMATNLSSPIAWQTLQFITNTGGVIQVGDTNATNLERFYRVGVQ